MQNNKPVFFSGFLLLGVGVLCFFGVGPQGIDLLVAGAVLIAGGKISHSIDEFRRAFEARQSG
jgi:hypothetical protein